MSDWLTQRFEENRGHLRRVAYRMLGSSADAEDAVQEAWLRLNRAENGGADGGEGGSRGCKDSGIENLHGWLTTVVSRICLDTLRARRAWREEPLEPALPEFVISRGDGPEDEAVMADSVGLALLTVLNTLAPAERLAFVLHDMFALSFDEIAAILDRSPTACRQLASRARRRVQGATPPPMERSRQRKVVDAFIAAAQKGDLEALIAVLDPDVVLRSDRGLEGGILTGAARIAARALSYSKLVQRHKVVLVNGAPGIVSWRADGTPQSVMGFAISGERITEMFILSSPERLRRLIDKTF